MRIFVRFKFYARDPRMLRVWSRLKNSTSKLFFFAEKLDEEVTQDGVRVFIDKKAQLTLLGTEMDYVQNKLSSEFVFNNPNIKGTCGCGESFSV